jgi:hypothetical protein
MVTKNDVFKSKYSKALDLKGGPVAAKIRLAALETLRGYNGSEERKVVVYFAKKLKPLILNRTNYDSISDIAGSDDTDNWAGVELELYATTADLRGKQVDCVRIRKPGAKAAPKKEPPSDDDLNDEITF